MNLAAAEEKDGPTHLRFAAGGRTCELPLAEVREVAPLPAAVARIPRSRPPIHGAVNLRGRVVALVDLAGLLGLPAVEADSSLRRAVVLEGSALALVVDEVTGFAGVEGAAVLAAGHDGAERLSAADLLARVERLLHAPASGLGYLHLRSNDPPTTERPWPSAS